MPIQASNSLLSLFIRSPITEKEVLMKLNIFAKIVGIPVLGMLLLAASITYGVSHFVNKSFDANAVQKLTTNQGAFDAYISDISQKVLFSAQFIAQRAGTVEAFAAKDSKTLEATANMMRANGINMVTISDAQGKVIVRSHSSKHGDSVLNQRNVQLALQGKTYVGIEPGTEVKLSVRAGVPVMQGDKVVGVITAGFNFSTPEFVDALKQRFGTEATVFLGSTRVSTTILNKGTRATGTTLDNPEIVRKVLEKNKDLSHEILFWACPMTLCTGLLFLLLARLSACFSLGSRARSLKRRNGKSSILYSPSPLCSPLPLEAPLSLWRVPSAAPSPEPHNSRQA